MGTKTNRTQVNLVLLYCIDFKFIKNKKSKNVLCMYY